jgi:hypothetical protein
VSARRRLRAWALVAGCAILACKGDRSAGGGKAPAGGEARSTLPDTASDPGAKVARRIVKAATLQEAISATREALTLGGLTLVDSTGATREPAGPASEIIVHPPEAVLLAYEAKRHATTGRLSLDEFATMLADFGWPFEGQGMPGRQLMGVMAEWVRAARKAPNDTLNFTPLFLADMARRQIPAVDLASDSTDPADVRLGYLEMQLFASAMMRGTDEPVQTGYRPRGEILTASYGATFGADPCAAAKEYFSSGLVGKAAGLATKYQVKQELRGALVKSGFTQEAAKQFTDALKAVKAAMAIIKMSELYGSANILVDHASDIPAERPEPGGEVYASVKAQAGLAQEEYEEYKKSIKSAGLVKSVRDCLEATGLPSWSDVSDVAEDLDYWRVHWYLGRGTPKHAWHVRERNDWFAYGQRSMLIKRTSPTSGEAVYTFKLVPEAAPGHPGNDLRAEVEVKAELKTSKPPTMGTVASAAFGVLGLVKSLVDVGVGWFQEMVTFDSYIMVPIVYHERGISLLVEDEGQAILQLGEKGKTVISARGSERFRHVYAGHMHLGEDSLWHGQVLVTANGVYRTADEKTIRALADKYNQVSEGASLEQMLQALAGSLKLLSDIPTCPGSYSGAQLFAVEGSFATGAGGKDQVELALIPAGPPEFYSDTPDCPWVENEIEGIKMIPVHLSRGQNTALVIDPPVMGQKRVYPKYSSAPGLGYSSTTITVGADFGGE